MNFFRSTKKDVDQDTDGEDGTKWESVEVVLVQSNVVNNNYQQASKDCLLLYQRNNLVN